MVKVKICGITNLEDACNAVEFGADIIGLNFYPGSKRYIDVESAESIIERLDIPVLKAGVFVNQSVAEIVDTVGIAGLDIIQLHGDEDVNFTRELRHMTDATILKVFRVGPSFDAAHIAEYPVDGVLLDSYSTADMGGTGMTFDWSMAASISRLVDNLYLAGGLTPENVAECVKAVRPYAVDVASGVESSPRKKDPKKLDAFIKNAKNA